MISEVPSVIKIFYCYAREDEELRNELEKHLRPLKRSGHISEWHDRQIQAGTDWEREIETHLNTASIILLLVSPDFIFSDYCYSKEMKRALERHISGEAHVIPIILRPVHWEETPIGRLQALPTDGEPITLWSNRDKAFLNVAKGIHLVVKMLLAQIQKAEEERLRKAREEELRKVKEEEFRKAQLKRFWKAHKLPTEDILIRAYHDIHKGAITSPSEIRSIASAFQTIASDSFASKNVGYNAARTAEVLYNQAKLYEEQARLAREEQARLAREEQARLAREEQARLAREEQARLAREEQVRLAQKVQLRLDVAQLTDVGRKREHNEDNMAYVIPKDPQVMAMEGALFIVADGMGGYVASEIAVDTISNMYYQYSSDDIITSLLRAIKRANASIHQRAAESMLRSGMSTTCVTALLCGNMAYIANVGDSRAYLVRSGQIKQISQDHSWVAEQVRAGLLTEDQARTHTQRDMSTRLLGTQVDVEIDVFFEQLEEKDTFVLCTDGLSGLVSDEEILRIVDQFVPQESVYHLVERANENGGPDNITAMVVHVLTMQTLL